MSPTHVNDAAILTYAVTMQVTGGLATVPRPPRIPRHEDDAPASDQPGTRRLPAHRARLGRRRRIGEPRPGRPAAKGDPQPVAVATLEGHWRVAGIDGTSLDEPVAIALTASDRQIWWEPRCAGMARNYRIEGAAIRITSALPPRAPGEPTPPVCAIGLPPRLGEVFRALDEATGIARLPSNGIRIAGPTHDVTIFAQ